MSLYEAVKELVDDKEVRETILKLDDGLLNNIDTEISRYEKAQQHAEVKAEMAKVPRLGDLDKGEHRLIGFDTIGLTRNQNGGIDITHAVQVQLPFTGNVLDFKFVQQIKAYTGKHEWSVHWNGEPESAEQFQRWLAAAAFAMQVMDQMNNIETIKIFRKR